MSAKKPTAKRAITINKDNPNGAKLIPAKQAVTINRNNQSKAKPIPTKQAVTINKVNQSGAKSTRIMQKNIPINLNKDYSKIACIMDEFSYKSFQYEASFIQLDPDDWEKTMLREQPQLLFVESAWRGKDLKWRNKIGGLHLVQDQTLQKLVNWCRNHKIPTVFWNKEDPSNFNHFIEAAKYFDIVFTTDINSIPRYQKILGHDQVFVLMFAAQPRLHNPINRDKEKVGKVAFAGTWYNEKHMNRKKELPFLLTPALEYDLHIYDRKFDDKSKYYRFPSIYQPYIKGFLPYDEMVHFYKKYNVFLNVNSDSNSPTMFSRRVFELLACGTSVISNYSLGIEKLFPDLVKLSRTEADTRKYLQELLNDGEYRDRLAVKAQREVFSKHTYKHRLEEVLRKIGITSNKDVSSGVSIISICRNEELLDRAVDNFLRQNHAPKELIIILPEFDNPANVNIWEEKIHAHPNIFLLPFKPDTTPEEKLKMALKTAIFPYISFFSADDYYAPSFLVDLLQAFNYTNADAVGKSTYYSGMGDTLRLNNEKLENQYADCLWGSAMVVNRRLFDILNDKCRSGFEYKKISQEYFSQDIKLYAVDRFNYICQPQALSEDNIKKVSI
ncbi:MAG: glycosyltransferase [Chitinophagales bacterium]